MIPITKGEYHCRKCALAVGCKGGCVKLGVSLVIIDEVFFVSATDCYMIYVKNGWRGRLEYLNHPRTAKAKELVKKYWEDGELIPKSQYDPKLFRNPRRCVVSDRDLEYIKTRCTITRQAPTLATKHDGTGQVQAV